MPLNLIHLQTFLRVAQSRSFSQAADELHLSQSSVSRQVQALEKELGLKLFAVRGRQVELSKAGRTLVPYAEKLLSFSGETENALATLKSLEHGEIRICASHTPGNYILPEMVTRFASTHHGLQPRLRVTRKQAVLQRVISGKTDLGVVAAPVDGNDFILTPVFTDRMILVGVANHPLARKTKVTVDDMRAYPLLIVEEGSGSRQAVLYHLQKYGLDSIPTLTMANPETIKRAVQAGAGVAFLSYATLLCETERGVLTQLDTPLGTISRPILAVQQKGLVQSPAARAFLDFLRVNAEIRPN